MKKQMILATLALILATPAASQETKVDPLHVDVLMKFAFSQAPKDWAGRVEQDATLQACSASRSSVTFQWWLCPGSRI